MNRIQHAIADRPALVSLLAVLAMLIVAACNNGAGGDSRY